MISPTNPLRTVFLSVSLAVLLFTAACSFNSTEGGTESDTQCDIEGCTVTLDNKADATASVAGVDIELVKVEGDLVTLRVAGQQIVVPKGESQEANAGTVSVEEITEDEVVLRVTVI